MSKKEKTYQNYKDLQHIHADIEPIVNSGLQIASSEFKHIVSETIRLLKEERE